MTAVVEAESLTKRFGEVPAVTDLSDSVDLGGVGYAIGTARRRHDGR
jgi:hypothetical protein